MKGTRDDSTMRAMGRQGKLVPFKHTLDVPANAN